MALIAARFALIEFESKTAIILFDASTKKDDFTQITLTDIRQLPIPVIPMDIQQPFINKVNAIFTTKQNNQDTRQLEQALDAMVYALYGLTDDEIKVIESANT